MQRELQRLKYGFKRNVFIGFALLLLVVIGAGCAASKPTPEQGPYIKIQGGKDSGGVTWSK